MRRILPFILLLAPLCLLAQTVQSGKSYYIVNNYYNRVLSNGATESEAKLSLPDGKNDDKYVFDCIASESKPDYVYLQQHATGLWFAATNQNTWGTVLTTEKNYYGAWNVKGGTLSNYYATTKLLGVDTGQASNKYIGVYYDKPESERTMWQFIEVNGTYNESITSLAIKTLLTNINQATETKDMTAYTLGLRKQLTAYLDTACYVYDHRDTEMLDSITYAGNRLAQLIAACQSSGADFILSGDSLNLRQSYTLALEGIKFRTATDSATIVLRNNNGSGMRFELAKDHITLRGIRYDYEAQDECSLRLVCDGGQMSIYRDGTLVVNTHTNTLGVQTTIGTACEWSILRSTRLSSYMPVIYSRNKALPEGELETDKLGHKVMYVVCIKAVKTAEVPDGVDMHILRKAPISGACRIDMLGENSRIIFDNRRPSDVLNQLGAIKINGATASNGTTCRVGIYLAGTVVFPKPSHVFVGYTGEQYTGDEIILPKLGNTNLGEDANMMRSFVLKRGYMAVLASGEGQDGYTRVYVADHEDIMVPVLPDALNRRVSSVHIKNWQYVSKKGWCSTTSAGAIATEMSKVNATWFYTWAADKSSTDNTEYIPIRQHIYWPSVSQIGGHTAATACLMMNEPDHSEQHNNCDCKGVISEWTACTKTPEMARLGMRVGSPAPTDATWLNNYIGHVDDMAYRCDFVAFHSYWGPNEANGGQAWYNRLKAIYDKTHRPIWITEWNFGASWTSDITGSWSEKLEKERAAIAEIINVLDTCSFVERYAIYNWDTDYRTMIQWDNGSLTPAGRVYRDYPSTFAYNAKVQKVPNWWAPGIKDISLAMERTDDGRTVFTINNPNGDLTDKLVIEQLQADGTYKEIYAFTDRYLFDAGKQTTTLDVNSGTYRARLTRTIGGESKTTAPVTLPELIWNADKTMADASSYIVNPDCTDGTQGWTVSNVETKNGEASDGDSKNWYWNIWKASPFTSTMSQELNNMPRGIYTLKAQLRGSSNFTQTLELKGDNKTAQQIFTGTGTTPADDGAYPMGWKDVETSEVTCLDGKLTISFKAVSTSGAGWWSADHFTLSYRPDPSDGINAACSTAADGKQRFDLQGRPAAAGHKGITVTQGRKEITKP